MAFQTQLSTRAPALLLLVGIVLGLCAAKLILAPIGLAMGAALLMALFSLATAKRQEPSQVWLLCFLSACLCTFWVYGSVRLPQAPSLSELARPKREVHLKLDIERVMQARNQYGKASGIAQIVEMQPASHLAPGTKIFFRIDLPEQSQLLRGTQIQVTGVLSPIPDQLDQATFDSYLKDTGIHYKVARTSGLRHLQGPSAFDQFCEKANHQLQQILRLGAPDKSELANIYIAMLLGRKAELSAEQSERFRITGTMHFFAISGLHIGVVATVIAHCLLLIRIPHRISPLIGLPLLYLYVEVTGASPSAIRAFLMAVFFWASFAFTRQRSPLTALTASAVLVLVIKPEQLWSIGFQLSYLVVLSILLFGLPLYQIISRRFAPFQYLPKEDWTFVQRVYAWSLDKLQLLFAISFSAWLASAPLSAAYFGHFSPGAIFLNMLLVYLATLTICGGVIALACGLIQLTSLAAFLNYASWLTITAMDWLVTSSTNIPGMSVASEDFSERISYGSLSLYFLLLFCLQSKTFVGRPILYLLPPSSILLGLCLGLQ